MDPRIRIANYGDHRTRDLLERGRAIEQEWRDREIEAEWRRRVKANEERRRRRQITGRAA